MKKIIVGSIIALSMLISTKEVNAGEFINGKYYFDSPVGVSYKVYLDCSDGFTGTIGNRIMTCTVNTSNLEAVNELTFNTGNTNVNIYAVEGNGYDGYAADTATTNVRKITFKKNVANLSGEGSIGTIKFIEASAGLKQVVLSWKSLNNTEASDVFSMYYDTPKLVSLKINGIEQNLSSNTITMETTNNSVEIAAVPSVETTLSGDVGTLKLKEGLNEYSITVKANGSELATTYKINITKTTKSGKQETETKKEENVKNPETSDYILKLGVIGILSLGTVILTKKKLKAIKNI